MKHEYKRCLNTDITCSVDYRLDIVGLLDSYGVPYSESVDKSFVEYITDNLKSEGKFGSSLDLYNLYINKTWQLNGIFNHGVTIGEMNDIQNFSIDFTRHKYPDMIKENIIYEKEDRVKDITVSEYMKNLEHPVIIYSCSANDIFYYFGASLESLNYNKCKEIISNYDNCIDRLGNNIDGNIKTLLGCNANSEIMVLGLYVPSDNFIVYSIGSRLVDKVNSRIKLICDSYDNVHYIDVKCISSGVLENDFHPNSDSQYVIAVKVMEAINTYCVDDNSKCIVSETHDTYFNKDMNNQFKQKDYAELVKTIQDINLPMDDYVECAVAFEQGLYDCNMQNVDYRELECNKDYIINSFDKEYRDSLSKALDIEIIEKKVLFGVDETENALDQENLKNDKLSLIDYY